jgi:hypothetical protein
LRAARRRESGREFTGVAKSYLLIVVVVAAAAAPAVVVVVVVAVVAAGPVGWALSRARAEALKRGQPDRRSIASRATRAGRRRPHTKMTTTTGGRPSERHIFHYHNCSRRRRRPTRRRRSRETGASRSQHLELLSSSLVKIVAAAVVWPASTVCANNLFAAAPCRAHLGCCRCRWSFGQICSGGPTLSSDDARLRAPPLLSRRCYCVCRRYYCNYNHRHC